MIQQPFTITITGRAHTSGEVQVHDPDTGGFRPGTVQEALEWLAGDALVQIAEPGDSVDGIDTSHVTYADIVLGAPIDDDAEPVAT